MGKNIRPIRRLWTLVVMLFAALVLESCGGSGSRDRSGPAVSFLNGAKGRLTLVVGTLVPKNAYAEAKAALAADVQALGGRFDDERLAMVSPTMPIGGYWVRVGKTVVMAQEDGRFALPPGTSGTTAEVLRDQIGKAVYRFPLSLLAGGGEKEVLATVYRSLDAGMGLPGERSLVAASCCGPAKRGETPRCLDYDGLRSDGNAYDFPDARRLIFYLGSTCQRNVWSGVCAFEKGSELSLPLLGGWTMSTCYQNHGFRYCQQITGELNLQKDAEAWVGDTVTLAVTNKTAGLVSSINLAGSGDLLDPTTGAPAKSLALEHSTEVPGDPSLGIHANLLNFSYRADLPPDVEEGIATITAESAGKAVSVQIKVKRRPSVRYVVDGSLYEMGYRGSLQEIQGFPYVSAPAASYGWSKSAELKYGPEFSGTSTSTGSLADEIKVTDRLNYVFNHPDMTYGPGFGEITSLSQVDIYTTSPIGRYRFDFRQSLQAGPGDLADASVAIAGGYGYGETVYRESGEFTAAGTSVNQPLTVGGKTYYLALRVRLHAVAKGGILSANLLHAILTDAKAEREFTGKFTILED